MQKNSWLYPGVTILISMLKRLNIWEIVKEFCWSVCRECRIAELIGVENNLKASWPCGGIIFHSTSPFSIKAMLSVSRYFHGKCFEKLLIISPVYTHSLPISLGIRKFFSNSFFPRTATILKSLKRLYSTVAFPTYLHELYFILRSYKIDFE